MGVFSKAPQGTLIFESHFLRFSVVFREFCSDIENRLMEALLPPRTWSVTVISQESPSITLNIIVLLNLSWIENSFSFIIMIKRIIQYILFVICYIICHFFAYPRYAKRCEKSQQRFIATFSTFVHVVRQDSFHTIDNLH